MLDHDNARLVPTDEVHVTQLLTAARPIRPRQSSSGRRPEPRRRPPGGQPNHDGQTRALGSVEEMDTGIPVKPGLPPLPALCDKQDNPTGSELLSGEDAQSNQVWEGDPDPQGFHLVEAMLTWVATLRKQQRNVINYVAVPGEAAPHGESAMQSYSLIKQRSCPTFCT